jgi:hypothetical protein
MANVEGMYSVHYKKDRAQRFYPSKFCGSKFCGSLFNQARTAAALTPETFLNLTSEPLNAEL